jgi:hypothetical protein
MTLDELAAGRDAMEERMASLEALVPAQDFKSEVDAWLALERERTQLFVEMAEAGSVEAATDIITEAAESGATEDLNRRSTEASVEIASIAGVDWYGC